jgi:hypothetical protein
MVLIEQFRKGNIIHSNIRNIEQLLNLIKSIKTHILILQDDSGRDLDICEVLKCQKK